MLYFTLFHFALSAYFLKGFRFFSFIFVLFRFFLFHCYSFQDFPLSNNKVKNNQCLFRKIKQQTKQKTFTIVFNNCVFIWNTYIISIYIPFFHQIIIPTHYAYQQNWFLQSNESLWHHLWILNSLAMIFLLKTNIREEGYDFLIKSFCTLCVLVCCLYILYKYIKRKGSIVWWNDFRKSFKLAIIFNVHHTSQRYFLADCNNNIVSFNLMWQF